MRVRNVVAAAAAVVLLSGSALARRPSPPADPIVVFETVKGIVEMQLFAADAPKSVAHIVALVKKHFYRGQRIHRVTAGLVQWGVPKSRVVTYKAYWGSGGSGTFINAFEVNKARRHVRGAVGLAHSGNPMTADSQLYVMKTPSPGLDGKHAVIGRVTAGMAVVDKLAVIDVITLARIKEAGPQ